MVHWIEEGHVLHSTRCSIPIRIISPRSIPTTQKWCKKCAYACPTKSTLCVLLLRIWPWNRRFINRTQYAFHCGNPNPMQKEMMIIHGHQRIVVIDATFGTNKNKVLQILTCSETCFVFDCPSRFQLQMLHKLISTFTLLWFLFIFTQWWCLMSATIAFWLHIALHHIFVKKNILTPWMCALNDHIHQNSPNWLSNVFILIV